MLDIKEQSVRFKSYSYPFKMLLKRSVLSWYWASVQLKMNRRKFNQISFFKACIAFLLYLDDVTNAYWKKGVGHFRLVFWWRDGDEQCRRKGKKRKEWRFSVCSFAHLLCVHTVFEEYFVIPFFFYLLTCTVSLHPFTKIPVRND